MVKNRLLELITLVSNLVFSQSKDRQLLRRYVLRRTFGTYVKMQPILLLISMEGYVKMKERSFSCDATSEYGASDEVEYG
jgi:hypothetical protein